MLSPGGIVALGNHCPQHEATWPYGRQTGDVVRPVTFSDCPWITAHSETIHLLVNAPLRGEAPPCKVTLSVFNFINVERICSFSVALRREVHAAQEGLEARVGAN